MEAEVEVVEAVAEVVEVALYSPGQDLLPLPHHHHLLADQEAGDYQDQVPLDLQVQVVIQSNHGEVPARVQLIQNNLLDLHQVLLGLHNPNPQPTILEVSQTRIQALA